MMNVRLALASLATMLGVSGVAFGQVIGNPFAGLGIDFYGFFLPWIFSFAIVYGLLLKLKLFDDSVNKRISAALAFVVAFFVTAVGGPQLATFFVTLFGGASMFLAGILVILLFAAMVGVKLEQKRQTIALIIVVIIGVLLFLVSSGSFLAIQVISDANLAGTIFWLIIIIAAVYLVMGSEEKKAG